MRAASFSTQANALLRKNIVFQKRNVWTNVRIVLYPLVLCLLLVLIQRLVDNELNKPKYKCPCVNNTCSLEYVTALEQVGTCPIPSPPVWPPLLQVPRPESRASQHCGRADSNCPASVLLAGRNQTLALDVAGKFFAPLRDLAPRTLFDTLSTMTPGTDTNTMLQFFIEPAFFSQRPVYWVQNNCTNSSSLSFPVAQGLPDLAVDLKCVNASSLWRENSSAVNDELYKGYWRSNAERRVSEIMAAYDFLDTGFFKFRVDVWYNKTYKNDTVFGPPPAQVRVVRSVNVITNAYIKHLKGASFEMKLEFIKEMPKPGTRLELDFSSLLGALFFLWVCELIFPVLLTYLVYEKQYNLRIMMKMHGLGDGPYWIITYLYFLLLSCLYILILVVFGSLIGLKFFSMHDYSLQFVFYFSFINLQIMLAFFTAIFFNNVKSAQAIAYVYVFGSGLLASFLFQSYLQDLTFSRSWIKVMEIFPAFALYRGLYEFGEYAFTGRYMGRKGMQWKDLNDDINGMKEVLIIIAVEFFVFFVLSYYIDRVSSRKQSNPLSFLCFKKKPNFLQRNPSIQRQTSKVYVEVDKPDVAQERELVEKLRSETSTNYAIISDNLKKVYPGRDGNPDKLAVQGLSLALPRGECFGMLGPNGAGKTTFINMMIGLIEPSSGNAYVEGHNIQTEMEEIYTSMGVCPQHDMLWETLTAREHLLFYGRLKNLKGEALTQAVEESLKSVNLFYGGVADKQARKYSGGMKRRLSVAISLIGNPKVVYMDEPSTGLDPASRNNLWKVIKNAKKNRAIILTTHSMEEAEVLCDRLGIFVGGALQCIGDPKQLKARYGDTYVFTITTSPDKEQEVENLVSALSSNANKIYHIAGTLKFEIPKQYVEIADVFQAVEAAKERFPIQAWGLANTTLEDVFIKVAKSASSHYELS